MSTETYRKTTDSAGTPTENVQRTIGAKRTKNPIRPLHLASHRPFFTLDFGAAQVQFV